MSTPRLGPGALAKRLGELEVVVEAAFGVAVGVQAADYPGGLRPSSALYLAGAGQVARGELVAFDDGEQAAFAEGPWRATRGWRGPVQALLPPPEGLDEHARWRRAALEGALIDLGLRQAGTTLAALTGVEEARVGTVISFAACADPAGFVAERAAPPGTRFKVDVDPAWTEGAVEALARSAAVAVLDFKGRGDPALAARLHQRFPEALLEDPPPGSRLPPERVVLDQPLLRLADVVAARAAGHGVNVKGPRMGGYRVALEALEAALPGPAPVYLGGMFEVGVGRRRARALAALFCPAGDNDLAPLRGVEPEPPGQLQVRLDHPGF